MRYLALLLAACGGASTAPSDGTDCVTPDLDAPWLSSQLESWVAGLTVAPRATVTQRDAARAYLAEQLSALGWTPQTQQYASGANIHATIPSTVTSESQIVVGAHFDSAASSPGANDNASGVAVVLAIARYLAETPCRSTPVIVVLFDEEEVGLLGARAFAAFLDPARTRAVHTIDQVAWDGDGDNRFELELPAPALEAEWRAAGSALGVTLVTTTTSGTDHEAFRDRGFAAIGLTEEYVGGDTSPHRHLPGDTAATVDADYLALATKLAAHVVLGEVAVK